MGPKKVLVQTSGSRGDIQPFIPMALAIRDSGCEVCVLTNTGHQAFVEEVGLQFYGVWIDAEKFIKENETCRKAMASGDTRKFLKCVTEATKLSIKDSTIKWQAAVDEFKPDLVISGTLVEMYGKIAAYRLGLPVFEVKLQAYPPNPKRASMGLPNLPCGLNGWLWKNVFLNELWKNWLVADDDVKEVMGFKVTDMYTKEMFVEDFVAPDKQPMPLLVAQASIFTDIIYPDLPKMYKCIGHSVIKSDVQVDLAKTGGAFGDSQGLDTISAFIAAGSRPVYLGWGSMICKSPEYMVSLVSATLKHSGQRAIIQGGWAHLNMDMLKRVSNDDALIKYMEQNALFVDKAPHEWLFQQCACTVHHGGAGTFGAAARAGVPTIITPVFLDQFDHAYLVNRLGFGIGFKMQLQKIKPEKLGDAINKVLKDSSMAAKAKEVSQSMQQEDGPAGVVEYMNDFWSNRVETGKFKAGVEARQVKTKGKGGAGSEPYVAA